MRLIAYQIGLIAWMKNSPLENGGRFAKHDSHLALLKKAAAMPKLMAPSATISG
jgi:hypothetical protein